VWSKQTHMNQGGMAFIAAPFKQELIPF